MLYSLSNAKSLFNTLIWFHLTLNGPMEPGNVEIFAWYFLMFFCFVSLNIFFSFSCSLNSCSAYHLHAAFFCPSCFVYILSESNFPSVFSSLCDLEIQTVFFWCYIWIFLFFPFYLNFRRFSANRSIFLLPQETSSSMLRWSMCLTDYLPTSMYLFPYLSMSACLSAYLSFSMSASIYMCVSTSLSDWMTI